LLPNFFYLTRHIIYFGSADYLIGPPILSTVDNIADDSKNRRIEVHYQLSLEKPSTMSRFIETSQFSRRIRNLNKPDNCHRTISNKIVEHGTRIPQKEPEMVMTFVRGVLRLASSTGNQRASRTRIQSL